MTDIAKTLNPTEVSAAIANASRISASAVNVAAVNTFIFYAGFDGTNNIESNPQWAGDKQSTAIGALSKAIPTETNNSISAYYPGVGTPGTVPGSSVLSAAVTTQAITTAENAYADFVTAASIWRAANPDGNITVAISTFSRGSITGAIFSQILAERGLTVIDPSGKSTTLIAPGEVVISNALVISPVTEGAIGNVGFVGVQNLTETIAANEYRRYYRQEEYPGATVNQIRGPGDHGDQGAFYDNGLSGIYLAEYAKFMRNTGLTVNPLPAARLYDPANPTPVVVHAQTLSLNPFEAFNLQNVAYGSLQAGTTVRTSSGTYGDVGQCTATGEVTSFVNQKGDKVSILKIGGITQSVTTTPANGGSATTATYGLPPRLVESVDFEGNKVVSAYGGNGILLQSTTTAGDGSIYQANYAKGVLVGSSKQFAPDANGAIARETYESDGITIKTRNTLALDGSLNEKVFNRQQQVISDKDISADVIDPATGQSQQTVATRLFDRDTGVLVSREVNVTAVNRATGTVSVDSTHWDPVSGDFQDRRITVASTNANGSYSVQGLDAGGAQIYQAVTTQVDAQTITQIYDATQQLQTTTTHQTYEDGTQLVIVKYPNGQETHISTATDRTSTQVDYPTPADPNTRTTTVRNATGTITASTTITPALDEYGIPIANTYEVINRDGAGTITATGARVVNPIDASYNDSLITSATADNPVGFYSKNYTDPAGNTTPVVNEISLNDVKTSLDTANDIHRLLQAIQGHNTLGLASSTLRLSNTFTQGSIPELGAIGTGLGAVTSLMGLQRALEKGDALSAASSGANLISLAGHSSFVKEIANQYAIEAGYSATIYTEVTGESFQTASALDNAINDTIEENIFGSFGGALAAVDSAIPFLSVAMDLQHGNYAGVIGYAIGYDLGGPIGGAIGETIGSFFNDTFFGGGHHTPPTWGAASVHWNLETGHFSINATGESGGGTIAFNQLASLITSTGYLSEQHNQADPNSLVSLIPQRLGALSYSAAQYQVNTVDVSTGQDINPGLRFDGSGNVASTYSGNASYFQTLNSYYTSNALARGAIAPLWEVQTAKLQDANGLSNAGLGELERAARLGQLANNTNANANTSTEDWNPIGLDFGGHLATTRLANSTVSFNVDGTADLAARLNGTDNPQYQHHSAWINTTDGLLVLDKNINGTLDNGDELFSNSKVAEGDRGTASLATWDANGDGQLDASDPIYSQMLVWRDANGDGQQQAAEVKSLNSLGIQSLDYANGSFTQGGQIHQMSTLTLQADAVGTRYAPKADGIQVNTSNGQTTLLVTQVHDLSTLQPNQDGFTTDENVAAVIAVRGNGITVQGLLDNDHVSNAPNALLGVSGVGNAQHGQVSLDGASGNVLFTPEANFYGTAGFDYVVNAGAYGQAVAHVDVNVAHVDQAPHITGNQLTQYQTVRQDPETGEYLPITYSLPWTGDISVFDPDDSTAALSWSVVNQPNHGAVSVNSNGHWSFTPYDLIGGTDAFVVQVKDASGLSDRIVVTVPLPLPREADLGGGTNLPVILDLNNTGFHFASVDDSNVFFASAADGLRHQTAWFGGGNGVLAFDKYGDGVVHNSSQIAFKDYLPGAQTDLQGLAAFDTNHDGLISKLDARWSQLGVWVDGNSDGVNQLGEYQSLQSAGIMSVSLSSNQQFSVDHGVLVHGMATFTRVDGTSSQVADVTLPFSGNVLAFNEDGSPRVTTVARADPNNPIVVGEGNNLVLGEKGDNYIITGNGNNVVSTGSGNDLIRAGNGYNSIYSGDGSDVVAVGNGNNTVFLQAGPKLVLAGSGDNLIVGGSGNNIVMAGAGNNTIYAGSGNSVLFAGNGDNTLVGGKGRNELIAGDGNNVFMDGGGRADMFAGTGSNTFVVTNALDTVTAKTGEGVNTVKASVNWTLGDNQDILWGTGHTALTLTGNAQDNQIIGNGAADTLIGGAGNDTLADSGGAAIMAGGVGDDTYIVTNAATTLVEIAGEGYDTVKTNVSYTLAANVEQIIATGNARVALTGNELDNVLTGNAAANILIGGAGNDTYVLQRGGGRDTVIDSAGAADSVLVRGNLSAADITLTRHDADVVVGIKSTADALVLKNWFSEVLDQAASGAVESIRFESGAPAIDSATIHALLDNHAPTAVADSAAVQEDVALMVSGNVLANDTDADLVYDSRQHLTVTNSGVMAGNFGSLTLAADGSYSYTLNNSDTSVQALGRNAVATDVFNYTVQDHALDRKTASAALTIRISGTNDAPIVTASVTNQAATEDAAWSFVVPINTFADVDAGDSLTFTGTLADGTALPSWLSFNAETRTFSGTPLNGDVGNLSLRVTAIDLAGAAVASSFNVTVANTNDAPIVASALTNQAATEDAVWSYIVPADTFTDVDVDDRLILTGTRADGTELPSWLTFNETTRTFSGTPLNEDVGNLVLKVTATDIAGATVSSSFNVMVINTNDAPIAFADTASVKEDAVLSATGNVLTNDSDVDVGDTLSVASLATLHGTYGELALAANGSYSYTLNNAAANVQSLRAGQQVSDVFAYSATDGLASATSNLVVTVTGTNDAPIAFADTASVKEDQTLKASGNVLTNDNDVDVGDTLKVLASATGLRHGSYGDLTLNADGSYSYALNNSAANVQSLRAGQQVSDVFTYSATDGLASATSNLSVTVTGSNDAPIAFADTASVKEDQTLSTTGNVLANDSDVDVGDTLKVLASATGLRHGTYGDLTLGADGSYSYAINNSAANVQALGRNATVTDTFAYTVTDDSSTPLQASATLSVSISGTNDGPQALADTASVIEDGTTVINGNVLANDGDVDVGDTLSVASPATLHGTYGDLALASNGSYSYTLNNAAANVQSLRAGQQVTDSFAYSATDGLASAASNLVVTVTGVNDAPIVAAPLSNRLIDQNQLYTYAIPVGTFTDVDAGDSLSLSAKLASGAALPAWLSFDAVKQTFTGTAPSTVSGLLALAVTATDRSGATATSTFALDISNVIMGTAKADTISGTAARDYIYGVSGKDTLSGGAGNDYLQAGNGDDTLDGGDGSDILAGGNGADVLRDLYGNNALLGGFQNDGIEAGGGNDFIAGGKHDDTIRAGGGANVIAFNEGDGRDTLYAAAGARNTLSLGGDIVASGLALHRTGQDLVLDVDSNDSLTFKNWYASAANQNFVTLQILDQIVDSKDAGMPFTQAVETFDFRMLVNKFDAATAATPKLTNWTLMNGLLDAHLASSTGAALGGELAARYAESAKLVMAPTAAQDVLRDASFGTQAQNVGTRVNDSVQTFRMG